MNLSYAAGRIHLARRAAAAAGLQISWWNAVNDGLHVQLFLEVDGYANYLGTVALNPDGSVTRPTPWPEEALPFLQQFVGYLYAKERAA